MNEIISESNEIDTRLYRSDDGYRWHSFIHEELCRSDKRIPYGAASSNIVLNHFAGIKSSISFEEKEEFYAWMIVKGMSYPKEAEGSLSSYASAHAERNIGYFQERSTNEAVKRNIRG